MTDYIKVLLSEKSTVEDRIVAADCIINNYDLPLARDEILKVFEKSRNDIYRYFIFKKDYYDRHEFLFNTLLNNNKNMLVAIIRVWYYNNCTLFLSIFVSQNKPYEIGCWKSYINTDFIKLYQSLLNYNDFKIDDLNLIDKIKLQIQEYRNEKYGGKLTKVVTND